MEFELKALYRHHWNSRLLLHGKMKDAVEIMNASARAKRDRREIPHGMPISIPNPRDVQARGITTSLSIYATDKVILPRSAPRGLQVFPWIEGTKPCMYNNEEE
jgi:hypothetical protein